MGCCKKGRLMFRSHKSCLKSGQSDQQKPEKKL